MKRFFVISLGRSHIFSAATVLLAAAFVFLLWPKTAYGGEGGYCETLNAMEQADDPVFAYSDPGIDAAEGAYKAKLAIIIDDFGQGREGVSQIMSIDRHLTFAVMPFSTFTKEDAEAGYSKGYEIIVHLPMEPMQGPLDWVGSNPILCSQDNEKIITITQMALADVPHAIGANVHMGSKASADSRVMHCILSEVSKARFYFVDSRTGVKSVIKEVADELNVPCLSRNVFLDGHRTESYTVKQLQLAESIALKNGYAIAIGHVGLEGGKPTAAAISSMLEEFDRNGVQLVFVSELFGIAGKPRAVVIN
jgi:uncharacterized protein